MCDSELFVNRVLCSHGRTDIFLKIMNRTEYPSFGNWIKRGATTLWEDYEGTYSRNHHMYADIAAVMQSYVAGIRQTVKCGVPEIVIEPYVDGFNKIKASCLTVNGLTTVDFERNEKGCIARAVVPFGVKSEFIHKGKSYVLFGGENTISLDK